MQNWDRNRQDVKFKQKLNNVKSTLPKISHTNNSGPSLIAKKSSGQTSNQNLNNLENLYLNATYKMNQTSSISSLNGQTSASTFSPQSHGSIPSLSKGNNNKEMKKQNYLKHLLKEFGLSQYLRKLYELGYDDNNINKMGLMNRREFQELLNNMKMFPGQSIKMEKLYDYLKQLNLANTMYNTRLLGGKPGQVRNNQKKPLTYDPNKRRVNTASNHINQIMNMNNNTYINNNTNNVNNYLNNNYKVNNQSERPKTSTTIKVKPIQKMSSTTRGKSNTIDNNMNMHSVLPSNNNQNNNNIRNQIEYDYINKNNTNNILLNSFKKGDFGYGFFMNNNNNNYEDAKNSKIGSNNYSNEKDFPKNFSSQNSKEFNKFENINTFSDNMNSNNYNDGGYIEEKMAEDIDNMLKCYMVQLNEKLDDSYGSVQDSSLSYNISLPFTEQTANNKVNKNINQKTKQNNISNDNTLKDENNKTNNTTRQNTANTVNTVITGKIKLPSIKDKQNISKEQKSEKSDDEMKHKENINQILQNQKKPEIKPETFKPIVNDKIPEIKKEKIDIEKKEIYNNSKIISDEENERKNKKDEIKSNSFEEIIIEDDLLSDEEKEKDKNNKKIEQEKKIKNKNKEIKKDENILPNKNNDNNNNNIQTNKLSESKGQKENDINIEENIEIIEEKDPEIKYGLYTENTEKTEDDQNRQQQNDRYSFEENIYDNLRLVKSSEGDYLHQNMEKFDIEYMCRCLSLAIMKLLESSKGKQHITDIMEKDNEKFEFFNNLFNSNMDIIKDFFDKNKDNQNNNSNIEKISNLEKLELKENKTIDDNNDITLLKHLKNNMNDKLLKEQDIKNKQFKLKNNLADIEKDIKFIDEFFSMGRKRVRNYQNISEKSKNILCKELSYINEVDSEINNTNKTNSIISNNNSKHSVDQHSHIKELLNDNEIIEEKEKKEEDENYDNEFEDIDNKNKEKKENESDINKEINNKFSSLSNIESNNNSNKCLTIKNEESKENKDDLNQNLKIDEIIKNNNEQIKEELPPINQPNDNNNKEVFESGSMESDYIIDINTMDKFKSYLLKQAEIFDDDFIYSAMHVPTRKYVPPPDPQVVFEFCANIIILTKMEKEVIIITLLYLERFIFNTGLLLTSRNWRRIIFITMAIASKIWDDDSFENNHFAQVFKHLSIGEINLLERTFLELINYKVYVKCSEYFKYFFIIKSIALKYNYNGTEMIPISVERMMKIQEYAYQMQKRVKKKVGLSNSTKF
jgi:hypothetical protein